MLKINCELSEMQKELKICETVTTQGDWWLLRCFDFAAGIHRNKQIAENAQS